MVVVAAVVLVPVGPALATTPPPAADDDTAVDAATTTSTVAGGVETTITVSDEVGYRDALAAASGDPSGPHTLVLEGDIVLGQCCAPGDDPRYDGSADLVIDGGGHVLDAGGSSRLLAVIAPSGTTVTIRDLALRNGRAAHDGGAVLVEGGAALSFEGVVVAESVAYSGDGGGVASDGTVAVVGSTFAGNHAVAGDGGAIHAARAFPVEGSTFTGNSARGGGALAVDDGAALRNVTITGNDGGHHGGGGLLATGRADVILIEATVAGNRAPRGANIDVGDPDPTVVATALADAGGGGTNCRGDAPIAAVDSFSDDASCGTRGWAGTDGADARLGPLADNGGPTETMLPAPDSPLVDAIDPLAFWGGPTIACTTWPDQRGVERPRDGNGVPETGGRTHGPFGPVDVWCDVGAVERDAPPGAPAPVVAAPRFTG